MSTRTSRCLWCNGSEGELIPLELASREPFQGGASWQVVLVHPEHREELLAFHAQVDREGSRFFKRVLLLLLSMAVLEVGLVLWHAPLALTGIGIAVCGLGLLIVRYPFPTPSTVQLLGARRALRLVRACGWTIALLGVALALAGVYVGRTRSTEQGHLAAARIPPVSYS